MAPRSKTQNNNRNLIEDDGNETGVHSRSRVGFAISLSSLDDGVTEGKDIAKQKVKNQRRDIHEKAGR